MDQRFARRHLQQFADFALALHAAAGDDVALRRAFFVEVATVGQQAQEAVLHIALGMGGHKGAFALAAQQQIFGGQLVDGLAHRTLAHAVARGQLHLAGDHLARFPGARLQALQDQTLDLLVQRAESRGRATHAVASGRDSGVVCIGGGRCHALVLGEIQSLGCHREGGSNRFKFSARIV